jgi:hypothetical protein
MRMVHDGARPRSDAAHDVDIVQHGPGDRYRICQ